MIIGKSISRELERKMYKSRDHWSLKLDLAVQRQTWVILFYKSVFYNDPLFSRTRTLNTKI